ncbi:S24 family peptidase [uncultured Phocaeicola sp.]|uniref:S24 family peptidase n=1 Tax=uncultured Phocaeicola sp. TaxID=990718 RepID=UPI0025EB5508|nr:S24 family peptidase [uncultured Phocaeicola sp.]
MSTVTERFFEVLDLTGETLTSLSNKIPDITTKQKLSNAKSGRNAIQIDVVEYLCSSNDKINSDYILTGRGTPLRENIEATQVYHPKYTEKLESDGAITLYDVEAAANLKTLFDNKDQNILGQISIPNIPKCDGAVYVKGDSMYPLLKSGDIVAYKEIPLEMNHIFFGEMYLVSIDLDGDEYLTVKYVQHSEKGEDWIKLVSYNQNHQPKDFPLSSVRAMALVKLSIRMNTMK